MFEDFRFCILLIVTRKQNILIKDEPTLTLLCHYIKMHPNSLWVSLDFEWIWTFLPWWNQSTPQEMETNCYGKWIGPLVPNEIQIYQAISLAN